MDNVSARLMAAVSAYAPRILAGLAILVVGWLVALLLAAALRGVLRRAGLNDRLPRWLGDGRRSDPAAGLARIVFYILMLFVLVATFQALGLTIVTEPLNALLSQVFAYAPRLLAGGLLLVLAVLLATGVRAVLSRLLTASDLDARLGAEAGLEGAGDHRVARSLAETAYWLILLLFLPAILGALGMHGLLEPVVHMTDSVVAFLPRLFAAAVVFLVGWFVARIVRRVVAGLLAAAGVDGLAARAGLGDRLVLSRLAGTIVYALILIPVAVAALQSLKLDAITAPATRMLDMIMGALPQVFAAALILGLSHVMGRFAGGLVRSLLAGAGFDRLPAVLGLVPQERVTDAPSRWGGAAVHAVIMTFAVAEAAGRLQFQAVAAMSTRLLAFAGQVALGLVILVAGMLLAGLAARAVRGTGRPQSALLATVARAAVLVLTGAMALREMGFAEDIVNLAFGLLLGAVAVAAALAFGLGGREAAARQLRRWQDREGNVPSAGE